jgi:thymidylate kinase
MLIICEGVDNCGKSTFIERTARTCIYEAHNAWGADITKRHEDGSYDVITTIDALFNARGQLDCPIALHFDSRDTNPYISFCKCLELSKYTTVYMDRSWISDIAYGRVYRNGAHINQYFENDIVEALKTVPHLILHFKRPMNAKYFSTIGETDQFTENKDLLIKVSKEYDSIMRKYKKKGLNVYTVSF